MGNLERKRNQVFAQWDRLRERGETDGQTIARLEAREQLMLADIAAKDAAARAYFEYYGAEHADGCPEDDTCVCPLVVAINRAFGPDHPGAALLEENERLRAALKEIANGVPGCDAEYLARMALEPKP